MNKSIKPLGCVLVVSDLMLATYIVTIVIFFPQKRTRGRKD